MINNTILFTSYDARSQDWRERTHLTHGPLTGSQAENFGRSRQPCTLVIHHRDLL